MPDDGPTSERLDSLRARWESELESDRPSGVFLQLADEYRRLGRTGDAVAVLEEGLGRNPNHPAALVALGRCRLEMGQAAESTEVLEKVIAADPTQMVAYRLLVEGYVERGRPEEARQRLRVYSLLNDSDPEIAELRRRIGEIERQHRGDSDSPYLEDAPEPAEEPVEAPVEASPGSAPEPDPAAPAGTDELFPHLADPDSRRRYRDALAGGDLFQVETRSERPIAEPAESAAPAASSAPPAPAVDSDAPATGDDLFALGPEPEAPVPDLSSLLDGTRDGIAAEPQPQVEPQPAAEPDPGPDPGPDTEPAPAAQPEPEPAAPGETSLEEDRAARRTVTLGRLYLRQGHREEAAAIFREVLEREPDNPEARAELEALDGSEGAPEAEPPPSLSASDLLAGWEEGSAGAGPEGMTARKRHVLERYLERLRGRSGRDVH